MKKSRSRKRSHVLRKKHKNHKKYKLPKTSKGSKKASRKYSKKSRKSKTYKKSKKLLGQRGAAKWAGRLATRLGRRAFKVGDIVRVVGEPQRDDLHLFVGNVGTIVGDYDHDRSGYNVEIKSGSRPLSRIIETKFLEPCSMNKDQMKIVEEYQ